MSLLFWVLYISTHIFINLNKWMEIKILPPKKNQLNKTKKLANKLSVQAAQPCQQPTAISPSTRNSRSWFSRFYAFSFSQATFLFCSFLRFPTWWRLEPVRVCRSVGLLARPAWAKTIESEILHVVDFNKNL